MQLEDILTTTNILFTLTILGVVFSIYKSYHKPQEDLDRKVAIGDVISEKDLSTKATVLAQKEAEGKAALLDQQVKIVNDQNEKKFIEITTRIDNAFTMAQNHINTIETEVRGLSVTVNLMTNKITELSTIINERIPSRNKNII